MGKYIRSDKFAHHFLMASPEVRDIYENNMGICIVLHVIFINILGCILLF